MRGCPGPGDQAASRVQSSYARANRGPASGSCSLARDPGMLSGRLGLMPPGVVDPPYSAREGISQ